MTGGTKHMGIRNPISLALGWVFLTELSEEIKPLRTFNSVCAISRANNYAWMKFIYED